MPGPLSSNVSRRPARPPLRSDCSRALPPPPWSIVFRASSLAAVTILVCSTRLKPISTARMRTTWRTTTMSFEERTGSVSSSGIANDAVGEVVLQRHGQAVVHVHLDADEQELVHLEDRNSLHAASLRLRRAADGGAGPLQRDDEGVGQRGLRDHTAELDAEMDDGLRDLRSDAADDAVGAHEARRRHG